MHLAFYSIIYGIIPYELIDSFPMGQHETSATSSINNIFYQNSIINSEKLLKRISSNYNKCALLIPDTYLNQFKELEKFPKTHPIYGLKNILAKIYGINFSEFNDISEIIQFFKDE
jgi:hypothetical protein